MAEIFEDFKTLLATKHANIKPEQHDFFKKKLYSDEKFRKQAEYYIGNTTEKIRRKNKQLYSEILKVRSLEINTIPPNTNIIKICDSDLFKEEILPEEGNKDIKGMSLYALYLQKKVKNTKGEKNNPMAL